MAISGMPGSSSSRKIGSIPSSASTKINVGLRRRLGGAFLGPDRAGLEPELFQRLQPAYPALSSRMKHDGAQTTEILERCSCSLDHPQIGIAGAAKLRVWTHVR